MELGILRFAEVNLTMPARDTFRNPDKISRDGDRFVYEKSYTNPVGIDANGNSLYKVRVVTEKDGTLVTAFPQLNWR